MFSIILKAKRDNAKMTGTDGGKEVKYKKEPPYPRYPSKDNPSVEGLDSDNCFQAEEAVVD